MKKGNLWKNKDWKYFPYATYIGYKYLKSADTKPDFVKGHIRFALMSIGSTISMVNKFQVPDYHQTSTISILISYYCRWPLSSPLAISLLNALQWEMALAWTAQISEPVFS